MRFFGLDGSVPVSFVILPDALAGLAGLRDESIKDELLDVFDRHFERICEMAETAYLNEVPGDDGFYVLSCAHLDERR